MQTPSTAQPLFRQAPASLLRDPQTFRPLLPDGELSRLSAQNLPWLSLWSHWFFAISLIGWAERLCCDKESLPLWNFSGQLQLNDRGLPEHWVNPGSPCYLFGGEQQQQHLERLIHQFITPACETLAALAGGNRRVFYSNAAIRLWQGMERADGRQADSRVLRDLFTTPQLTDGSENPMYSPYRIEKAAEESQPKRRHCCMLFRLDGYEKCASCPTGKCKNKQ